MNNTTIENDGPLHYFLYGYKKDTSPPSFHTSTQISPLKLLFAIVDLVELRLIFFTCIRSSSSFEMK
jgi:hypothetical protein